MFLSGFEKFHVENPFKLLLHFVSPQETTVEMDFQHRAGGKTGTGGVASFSESNRDRRERLRQLALETIDLNKVSCYNSNYPMIIDCSNQFVIGSLFYEKSSWRV